jgi:acid phosphatase (class A)
MKRILIAALVLAGCSAVAAEQSPAPVAAPAPAPTRLGAGYLDPATIPQSVALSPPPPAPGSAAEARDQEAQRAALTLHGTLRWALATADADIFTPRATNAFSCAAGIALGPQTTPLTDALLRKTLADFGMATRAIKNNYKRARPFTVNQAPQCTPDFDAVLRHDGSYPSGHATIGFGWGALLAQLIPTRASELVARGRAFADSRRVCNVHWRADVEEGSVLATPILARLNANTDFQRDLAAARAELAQVTAPPTNCAAEAAALTLSNN